MYVVLFHLAFGLASLPEAVKLAEPLHPKIDAVILQAMSKPEQQAATTSRDDEFLRRIYLDLVGAIPTVSEARTFLSDKSVNKRAR